MQINKTIKYETQRPSLFLNLWIYDAFKSLSEWTELQLFLKMLKYIVYFSTEDVHVDINRDVKGASESLFSSYSALHTVLLHDAWNVTRKNSCYFFTVAQIIWALVFQMAFINIDLNAVW